MLKLAEVPRLCYQKDILVCLENLAVFVNWLLINII